MQERDIEVFEDEKVDDLDLKGYKIIQKKKGFCFGIDAVLLSYFADVGLKDKVLDLGTGTGIIPILIAGHTKASEIIGVEIQKDIADMAQRSVFMNRLEDRVTIRNYDLKCIEDIIGSNSIDVVVTNPPYIKVNGGLINDGDMKAISRHEIKCTLDDVIRVSAKVLKHNGRFCMVNRPDRLVDIMTLMRKYYIEPKSMRLVYPKKERTANLVLIMGKKGAKSELKIMEPLYVYDDKGNYTKEIDYIYNRREDF
ncbi:MAG: tRNA1(Val) (adenine(37)-N6)-methyltransferase [Clostridiales bacterium]|nr:tRNA1(Val) (adenine(37)-N6)-methyltransferase [Clostridiales bacterium]